MIYQLIPGIACFLSVKSTGYDEAFIYLSGEKLPVSARTDSDREFLALPLEVRAAINRHFGIVFSLPVGSRAQCLKDFVPIEVDA
jgi:hypothetical protein